MKAAVYYKPGDIRIEERATPLPKSDNIIIKINCTAICGSDLKLFKVGSPKCKPPRIIGHETVGTITHVGEKVKGFVIGERVTLATTVGCGNCFFCNNNLGNICENTTLISNDIDGAFAEYTEIPFLAIQQGNVIKIPDTVADDFAALGEPLSCAINAQELARVTPGAAVLILGGGPLGAIHAMLALANGADKVLISQRSPKRLALLSEFSGIDVTDSNTDNIEKSIMKMTDNKGADVVIVSAPSKEVHEQSLKYVRKGGKISFFAGLPAGASEITIDSRLLHYREVQILGTSDSRPEHVRKGIELIASGKINLDGIVTHKIALDDLHTGLELMKNGDCLKVLVYP